MGETERYNMMWSPELREATKKAAERAGQTVSEYIRQAIKERNNKKKKIKETPDDEL